MSLTSDRAPEEWAEVFGNPLLPSAALDRLTQHSHFIEMVGESYHQPQRKLGSKEPRSKLRGSLLF
ncbi:ATP-binding protein [Candidatus Bipolaricaulota bacterium]|nr:ATP-binding protein [Candidatus Bipolaricaulota bacterium]